MLETNYFIVSFILHKREPSLEEVISLFSDISWDTLPQSYVPCVKCQEEAEQCCCVRKSKWGTGHIFLQARKGWACHEIPAIFSHLVCTSMLHSHHVVPWHPWRQLLIDIILSLLLANINITLCWSWTELWTDNLYVPCTYHVQQTAQPLPSLCSLVQYKAQLTLHLLLNLASHFETRLCYS